MQEEGVLTASDGKSEVVPLWPGLTFEQQRELLLLQCDKELEKIKYQLEHDKMNNEHEIELERMKNEIEQIKLKYSKQGWACPASAPTGDMEAAQFDITKNLKLGGGTAGAMIRQKRLC